MTWPGNGHKRYWVVFAGRSRNAAAGDLAVLLGELIPGYEALPGELRGPARVAHAEQSLGRIQRRVLSAYGSSGCDAEELRVLLDDSPGREVPRWWSAPVPLVLVDAHFAGRAGEARPGEAGGRIVWLETGDDESYLRSLAVAGEIFLAVTDDAGGVTANR